MKDYYDSKQINKNKILKFKLNNRDYGKRKFYNKKGKR